MALTREIAAGCAAVGVIGLLAAGCSVLPVNVLSDDSTQHATITAVRLVDVGGLRLTPSTGGPSTIHREIHYGGSKPGVTARMDGTTLILTGCGEHCLVDYTVAVPRGVAVRGTVSAGAAELTGTSSVDVRDGAGPITVTEASGPVRVDSSAGSIKVTKVDGTVDAQSSAGSVDVSDVTGAVMMRSSAGSLTGDDLRGPRTSARSSGGTVTLRVPIAQDVVAESSAGGIDLTVPPAAYRVQASASAGSTNLGFRPDPNGRYLLDLRSSAGDITVHTG